MRYNKTRLNPKELQTLLENGNPQCYDEIEIVFNNYNILVLYDLRAHYKYGIDFLCEDGGVYSLKKPYYPVKQNYYDTINEILMGSNPERYDYYNIFNGETYEDIKAVNCFNYSDANITNYAGEKMDKIHSTKDLKQFFMDNQKMLKYTDGEKTNYGGSVINGVGARKVMINEEFYSYKNIYDVLTGKEVNHDISFVLRFLIKS